MDMTITSLGGYLYLHGEDAGNGLTLRLATTSTKSIVAYGLDAAYDAIITNSQGGLYLYGYGYDAFEYASVSADGGPLTLNCRAEESFQYASLNMTDSSGGTNNVYGNAGDCFYDSHINLKGETNNLFLYSRETARFANFVLDSSSVANVYVYGYQAAYGASFIVKCPTAYFDFYGYYSGLTATVNCDTSSTCNIDCLANGCDGLTLICNGVCNVNCDESRNISCPVGYVGPTPKPTQSPTYNPTNRPTYSPIDNPTTSPTGGSEENVTCHETQQCAQ